MWGMINSLQVVGILPLMKISTPYNLKFVLQIINSVVQFDFFDLTDAYH